MTGLEPEPVPEGEVPRKRFVPELLPAPDGGPGTKPNSGTFVMRVATPGMITLRGRIRSEPIASAVRKAIGIDIPEPRRILSVDGRSLAWMSPDELLILTPLGGSGSTIAALSSALEGQYALLADVSDARLCFRIAGPSSRELIAKGCPVDLSPEAFSPGDFRRSRLGQVPVALWMPDPGQFMLLCFRSVSDFVEHWLQNAAQGEFPGNL